jgi:hypothetical protein
MATHRLFTVLAVSVTMLMVSMTGGIAGAAPVAAVDKCVASTLGDRRLAVPASQRYLAFKEAESEQMAADASTNDSADGCEAAVEVASGVIRRPLGYAAFKELQAGNDILQANTKGTGEVLASRNGNSVGISTVPAADAAVSD